jgi:3-methylcrotonyl-CoA carboxylase alpha subunit
MSDWRDGERTRSVTLTPLGEGRYRAEVDGVPLEVTIAGDADGRIHLTLDGQTTVARVAAAGERRFVRIGRLDYVVERAPRGRRGAAAHGGGLEAPMPGLVTRVMAGAGDTVTRGQPLVAIEAMKMEHLIRAPRDGVVRSIAAKQGQMVDGGIALVELEAEDA